MIVGFGYKARQGKNTAALAFMEATPIGADVRLLSFADALRAEIAKAARQMKSHHNLVEGFKELGLMPDWVKAEYVGKQRSILQWWGTEYRRAQDPDYWVKRFLERLDQLKPDIALVTDVRFPNEADAVHARGGYLVKVTRLSEPDVLVAEHPSETALDTYAGWDYELEATTADELKRKTRELYREIARRSAVS